MHSTTQLLNSNRPVTESTRPAATRPRFLFVALALASLIFPGVALAEDGAVGDGSSTAEGTGALAHLTTGVFNTATGFVALSSDTTGLDNTATGAVALAGNTTGSDNTATGVDALNENNTGNDNTATGVGALFVNTTGSNNTATGFQALLSNNADFETATGYQALSNNTTGGFNTADGYQALYSNTTGRGNTGVGYQALMASTGKDNTAVGTLALSASTADVNTAIGSHALWSDTTGGENTAAGVSALSSNTTGNFNTATGVNSLFINQKGNNNTATGVSALYHATGSNNTATGLSSLINNSTGSNNTAVGYLAGENLTTGSNNIDIGANVLGNAGEANTIRIGKQGTQGATYVAGIYSKGIASATGVNVKIDSTGKLGTVLSSARYKEAMKPMDKASESILELKPITFRYKKEFDPDGVRQFGLVAEEVEKVCPDLVVKDEEGKPLTVRYDAVNAMLLNEFLKEHNTVQELKKEIAVLMATVKEQAAQIQKVSAQVELSKSAPQTVANNQ
jgi:hypothetical protein